MTVELYDPNRVYTAPAGAHLTYRGGPLLKSVEMVGVFIDDFPYAKEMAGYLTWLAGSDVLGELAEYNTGLGQHVGDVSLSWSGNTPPPPPPPTDCVKCLEDCFGINLGQHKHHGRHPVSSLIRMLEHSRPINRAARVVTDGDIQIFITSHIADGSLPAPNANTLYALFLPDGMSVSIGQDASCQTFCGYHNSFVNAGQNVFYAVLPFPSCTGCLGTMQPFDALTSITSHEVCEAVTDPVPGSGWYDDANGEVGDICAWQTRSDGGYTVQLEWSNQHNACI